MDGRRLIPALALASALGLATAGLTGCATDDDGRTGDGKVKVTAAFYPMAFLAERIGGDHVTVTNLTKPGAEPHDLELSPKQTGQLSEAGLIVYLKGIQPAVDEAVQQSGAEHVAEASRFTKLEDHGSSVHGHDHGDHDGEEHEGDKHEDDHGDEHSDDHGDEHKDEKDGDHGDGEKKSEEDDHGHDHDDEGGPDPHVWLDPAKYAEVAKGVGRELAKSDPDHEDDYQKNTDALVKRLQKLDKEFRSGLTKRKTSTFITTHAAFGYLAERYGLHQEAISGISPEAEPSAARMKELHRTAEKDRVNTVFFETLASDRTARTLAKDLDLRTDVLDPLEGVRNPKKEDYFSVMQKNLTALRKALNGG
ncbi:metal ABC transporter substrate-binding protein [Streptomyces sp. NPDC005438]|uniref:metal ABC transporter substrate-binding protein n=1 Tax=Streptomyces sp. NPDC005438 TaxID=3156880 RepID=UPI0033A6EFBF